MRCDAEGTKASYYLFSRSSTAHPNPMRFCAECPQYHRDVRRLSAWEAVYGGGAMNLTRDKHVKSHALVDRWIGTYAQKHCGLTPTSPQKRELSRATAAPPLVVHLHFECFSRPGPATTHRARRHHSLQRHPRHPAKLRVRTVRQKTQSPRQQQGLALPQKVRLKLLLINK